MRAYWIHALDGENSDLKYGGARPVKIKIESEMKMKIKSILN